MSGAAPQDSSYVPPSVQKAGKRADELFKAQFKQQDAPVITPGGNEAPAPQPAPATPAADPAPAPVPQAKEQPDAERRYLGEKGRREEAERRLREAQESLAAMQRRLDDLEARLAAPASSNPPPVTQSLITKEEEESYTPEFIDLIRRAAREEVMPVLSKVDTTFSTIDRRVQSVSKAVQLSAREKMYQYLDQSIPNWREINRNEEFLQWLDNLQPLTRQMRSDLLQSAYGSNDGPAVAQFFSEFLRERGLLAPQATPPTPSKKPGVALEDLAAPGRSGSVAPNTPADAPFIKRSDITAFYSAVTRGQYKNNPKLEAEMREQIDKAVAEGRVIN